MDKIREITADYLRGHITAEEAMTRIMEVLVNSPRQG